MKLCLIWLLIATSIAYADPETTKGGHRYKNTGRPAVIYEYYKAGNDMIKHGKEVHYYNLPSKNGKRPVKVVRHWLKGVSHGLYTEKFPDGTIKETGRYEKGNKAGKWRSFHKIGSPHKEAGFVDGRLHGKVLEFSPGNQKVSETDYEKGKRHGTMQKWYENGKPKLRATYRHGKLHGKKVNWYPNGKEQSRTNYSDGVKHGMEKLWNEKGFPTSEIEYRQGKKQGMVRLWNKNGKLMSEIEYLDSKPNGSWKEYYSNGVVSRESNFKQGLLHGVEIFRLPSGINRSLVTYRAGKEDGKKIIYYEDGKPKKEVIIKQDNLHGPATYYSLDGKVFARGEYRHNKPLDGTFAFEDTFNPDSLYLVHIRNGQEIDFALYHKGVLADGTISTHHPQSGQLISRCSYSKGMKHGKEEIYFSNGKIGRKATWFKNQPDGLVEQWHKKGVKVWEVQYEKGKKNGYEKAWDLDGNILIDGVYRDGKPWDGTLFMVDPKTKGEVILVFNEGKQIKALPERLKKMFSESGDSELLLKGNVERIPWKDLGVGRQKKQ